MRILYLVAIGCATTLPTAALAEKASQAETARHQAMAKQAQQADANVERQLKSIEMQLKQEEQRMNARLAQLSKMRDAALKKSDEKALKRIEQLEMQAVKQYESRVAKVIGAAPGKETAAAKTSTRQVAAQNAGVNGNRHQRPAPVMQAPGSRQSRASQQQQQQLQRSKQKASQNRNQTRAPKRSKRLKLWPF